MVGDLAFTGLVVILTAMTAAFPTEALRAVSWMKRDAQFSPAYVQFVQTTAAVICVFNLYRAVLIFLT